MHRSAKRSALTPILVTISDYAICVDTKKKYLTKKFNTFENRNQQP